MRLFPIHQAWMLRVMKLPNPICWHTHRREKTSECPFNLNQALWGFSLWNAPFVRARDCSQSEQDTKLDKTKNVGYLLPLISMTELIYLTSRQTTLSFRLIQIVGGLVGEVREAATAAMDQVDKLPLFRSMGLFHASWPLARRLNANHSQKTTASCISPPSPFLLKSRCLSQCVNKASSPIVSLIFNHKLSPINDSYAR